MQGDRHEAPPSQISFIAFLFPPPLPSPHALPWPQALAMTSVWKAGLRSSRAAVMTQHSHFGCGTHSDLGSWFSQMCWYLHCCIISWVSVSLFLEICSVALALNLPCFCLFSFMFPSVLWEYLIRDSILSSTYWDTCPLLPGPPNFQIHCPPPSLPSFTFSESLVTPAWLLSLYPHPAHGPPSLPWWLTLPSLPNLYQRISSPTSFNILWCSLC